MSNLWACYDSAMLKNSNIIFKGTSAKLLLRLNNQELWFVLDKNNLIIIKDKSHNIYAIGLIANFPPKLGEWRQLQFMKDANHVEK